MLKKTNPPILHITSEFTKKNFSISSLIFFIINKLNLNLKSKSFVSYYDEKLNIKRNKNMFVNFIGWFGLFKIDKFISKENAKNDLLIHIHGIWAPIQIYSLIIANMKGVPTILHPHGMLLKEAMLGGGYIKCILKKIILHIISFFSNRRKIVFIAITNQEINSIKEYFPKYRVFKINNPIPFDHIVKKKTFIKKKFSFFGRIHQHKKIEFIIKAFIRSNLDKEWSLELYGIADDKNYFNYLKKKYFKNRNIKFLKPVFGKKKEKIMLESWFNILASKSEVLSLSILEAGILGLPSLVTDNIELIKDDNLTRVSNNNINSLSKLIIKVSKLSNFQRQNYGLRVKNFFIKYQKSSVGIAKKSFMNIYNLFLSNKKGLVLNYNNNQNFVFSIFNHSMNLFFPTFLLILMTFSQRFSLSAELGITISICLTGTQFFSGNARNILLNANKKKLINQIISFRILVSLFGIFLTYLIFKFFFDFTYFSLCFLISIIIFLQWIFEILLVRYEIENSNLKQFVFFMFQIVFIGVIVFLLIFTDIKYLIFLLFFYSFLLFIFIINNFNFSKINILKYIFKYNLSFLSSFSLVVSSLVWRLFIFNYFNKEIAGILFTGFALGSFLGTFYNIIIGPTFVKNKFAITIQNKILFLLLFISLILFTTFEYYFNKEILISNNDYLLKLVTFVSLAGGFIMIYSMHIRHKIIGLYFKDINKLFYIDVMYGLILSILLPILYHLYNLEGVIFSYLLGSILALIIYGLFNYSIINKNYEVKTNI